MNLTYRKADKEDFAGVYRALFSHQRDDEGLRAIVETEWNVILANPATLCMVVEDTQKPVPTRILGCAQSVFVSDAFVRVARAGETPYPIQRLTGPLPDGSQPLLTMDQVRAANSGNGLNAFTTRWGWDDSLPDAGERERVRAYMEQKYPLFYIGYNFKEILMQAVGGGLQGTPDDRLQTARRLRRVL